MSEMVQAAIAIHRKEVRYAALERSEGEPRLRRADRRELDFDVAEAVLGTHDDMRRLGPLAETIGDLAGATETRTLRVAVHPPQVYSFFVPIAVEASVKDRRRQVLRQSALVTGVRSAQELALQSTTVRTDQDDDGDAFAWVHVLAVPSTVDTRMQSLLNPLPVEDYTWTVTTQAAARMTAAVERTEGGSPEEALRPFTLAVGRYPTHVEFSLVRDREWYHALYTEETDHAGNQAYFATGFLNRVGVAPDEVSRLFAYGPALRTADFGPFESVFRRAPTPLDPGQALGGGAEVRGSERSAYVPCIGAALDAFGE